MQSPTQDDLLAELHDRATVVLDLDGPQIEAWTSGLFAVLDDDVSPAAFAAYCATQQSPHGELVCHAITYLAEGLDPDTHAAASATAAATAAMPAGIGGSQLTEAWEVRAPFGRSIVLGFDPPDVGGAAEQPAEDILDTDEQPPTGHHAILVEIGEDGVVADLQLSGPAAELVHDAAESDSRVEVQPVALDTALAMVVDAWPPAGDDTAEFGPGVAANQQFVRQRLRHVTGQALPALSNRPAAVDIRRGLDDNEFERANAAARSTLRAAIGEVPVSGASSDAVAALASVVRGDSDAVTGRERDALLWLEWADWLGAGIGLTRAGVGASATGLDLVDYVNRCPEVSSTIDKDDREYAGWAFDVALDLLEDAGLIAEGTLTAEGHGALAPGLMAAWGEPEADQPS